MTSEQHPSQARRRRLPDLYVWGHRGELVLSGPAAQRTAALLAGDAARYLPGARWAIPEQLAEDVAAYAQAARLLVVGLPTPTPPATAPRGTR